MIAYYLSIVETEEERDKVIFIYEHFHAFMCYTAGQVLRGNIHDIEDTVHDAMIKIIDNIDLIDLSDKRRARNLCGIVAKNKAKDRCKLKANQTISYEDLLHEQSKPEDDPDEIVINKDTYRVIINTLRSLDDRYRDICMLKYVHQLKEREIALILDITPKTVSTRIFRGKQLLREALRKENLHV